MKAYAIARENRHLRATAVQVAAPEPAAQQLLVKVGAASLNRGELLALASGAAGKRLGNEVAGEVVAVGSGVSGWGAGDRVMGRASGGGFAEMTLIDAWEALPVPASLTLTQAAAVPLVFTVAWDMLRWRDGVAAGDTILIAGVTSGVGTAALLLARALGARVIGTSRTQGKLDGLVRHGLDLGLADPAPGFADEVKAATAGVGAKLAINVVGGTVMADCLDSLAVAGSLGIVGYMDGVLQPPLDIGLLHERRLSVFGVSNRLRTREDRAELVADVRTRMLPLFEANAIVPIVDAVYPEAALQEALAHMESDVHTGKIVVSW